LPVGTAAVDSTVAVTVGVPYGHLVGDAETPRIVGTDCSVRRWRRSR